MNKKVTKKLKKMAGDICREEWSQGKGGWIDKNKWEDLHIIYHVQGSFTRVYRDLKKLYRNNKSNGLRS